MKPALVAMWLGLTVCLVATAVSQDVVRIGDDRFRSVNGEWFQLGETDEEWRVVPGVIGVRFDSSIDASLAPLALRDLSLSLLWPRPDLGGYYRFSYDPSASPPAVLEATRNAPHVVGAYLDTELRFLGDPDPYFENQWNLLKARVEKAWDITMGDSTLTIAILDSGFQVGHEDLIESLWTNEDEGNGEDGADDDGNGYVDDVHGWDFAGNDSNVEPAGVLQQHGTSVAGIASASANNGKGIAGVAGGRPGNRPRVILLRVHQVSNLGPAIEYAWRAGADIVSMSFGGFGDGGGAGTIAIDSVFAEGALLFAALGNGGQSDPGYILFPATHPDVIAVGSTDESDVRTCNSNYGSYLDLMAPSSSHCLVSSEPFIWTTDNYNLAYDYNPGYPGCQTQVCASVPPENQRYFGRFTGTSAACPFAAAVGGLLRTHMPGLTSPQLRARLESSAIDLGTVGRDDEYGHGRVDAYRALTEWGTLTGNVTWSPSDTHNGIRYIAGDLTIATGATLTIMPGTVIKISNDDDLLASPDTARVEIKVQGTLVANGTALDPIVFDSWHPTTTEDWAGIQFDSTSGGGTFNHCIIKRAECAIGSYVPITVTNSTIDSCGYAGVVSSDGGAVIEDCTLTNPGAFGILLAADSIAVSGTVVDGATTAGLHVEASGNLTLRESTVRNCDLGIYSDGSASIDDCSITYAERGVESYGPLTIRNSEIDSCSYAGVVSLGGGAFVRNCTFTDPGVFGVVFANDGSVIRETVIDGATTAGCHLESGAALTFRQSTVANSGTGLYVDGTASVDVDSTCYVWTNDTGFHFYNNASLSTIKSCGITWNASTAVFCDNSSPRIEGNTFAHNGGGVYCSNSSAPVIEFNKMQTSGNVVTATSLSSPDVGHLSPGAGQSAGYNKIAHSTKYVANYTAATILAQNNCWNINAPPCNPPSSRFTGSVDWSDPDCCSFPLFSHGEGEPEPSELVFELPPASPDRSGKPPITGLIAIVPNPFNPTTAISYSLAARGNVEIKVYDVGGRLVRVLKDETMVAGQHSEIWNGTDGRGSTVASGVYFVRMTATGQVFTRKMVLLK